MAASGHQQNQLLAGLDRPTFGAIESHLSIVQLELGRVLADTHAHVQKVYFPHGGIISCVVELVNGGAIETGMIGKDGQFGGGPALDHKVSPNRVIMQVQASASVVDADRLRLVAQDRPNLREMILRYEMFFLAQVQQTAACNAAHDINARTCKWLLRMQALVGDELVLTQEFLAQMMGVRRTSVTEIAGELQRLGIISSETPTVRTIHGLLVKKRDRVSRSLLLLLNANASANSHRRLLQGQPEQPTIKELASFYSLQFKRHLELSRDRAL